MSVGRPSNRVVVSILSLAVLIAACGSNKPSSTAAPPSSGSSSAIASAAATTAASASAATFPSIGEDLPTCADPTWRCLTVDVPLDRSDPSKGTIPIHAYIQSRTSQTTPPMEPVIVTPGGPGASMWADHGWLPMADWWDHHDTVLIDPRGVGESGTIDCPKLQAGPSDAAGPQGRRRGVRGPARVRRGPLRQRRRRPRHRGRPGRPRHRRLRLLRRLLRDRHPAGVRGAVPGPDPRHGGRLRVPACRRHRRLLLGRRLPDRLASHPRPAVRARRGLRPEAPEPARPRSRGCSRPFAPSRCRERHRTGPRSPSASPRSSRC